MHIVSEEKVINIRNPASQKIVGTALIHDKRDIDEAVARAQKAQKPWSELSFKERITYFKKLRKIILQNQDEIVKVIQKETSKTFVDAATEVVYICGAILYFTKQLKKKVSLVKQETQLIFANKLALSTYQPWPVVGMITPWNLPFTLTFGEAIPYLMMGSAVILKPSEWTPFSALLAEKFCQEVGIPVDIFQIMTGDGETGAALVESNVDFIAFTGSERTGKKIGEQCGKSLKPYILDLGGKTPFLILENNNKGNLKRAVHCAVWSAFANTGQYCKSTERLYVVKKHADYVIPALINATQELEMGRDYGPIIPPFQAEFIREHIADAKLKGAKV